MIDRWIVAHDAHIPDVAAGRKALGNHVGDAEYAMDGKPIHVGCPCGFQRRFASENVKRIVRHAVALKNDVFHFFRSALKNSSKFLSPGTTRTGFSD
jgi:hypothetical protein